MYTQREIEEIRSKRRRLRNEEANYEDNQNSPDESEDPEGERAKEGSSAFKRPDPKFYQDRRSSEQLAEEFVDNFAKIKEDEDKVSDPWLDSLKTSNDDDTQVVYDVKPKEAPKKVDKMAELYDMPTVELIRLLVAKLQDDQTPTEYLKSKDYKDKSEGDAAAGTYDVSDLAHVLTMTWQNVYFMSREEIVDAILSHKNNKKECKHYEFRWVKDELAIHGPYSHEDILMWIVYSYVSEENPILLRELDNRGRPLTQEWTFYKDADVYNILGDTRPAKREPTPASSTAAKQEAKEEAKEEPEDADDEGGDEDDTFAVKKKPKLIGVRVKDKDRVEQESDDEELE